MSPEEVQDEISGTPPMPPAPKAEHNPRQVHTLAQLADAAKKTRNHKPETLWCPGRRWQYRSARVLMWFPGWVLLKIFARGIFREDSKPKTKGL